VSVATWPYYELFLTWLIVGSFRMFLGTFSNIIGAVVLIDFGRRPQAAKLVRGAFFVYPILFYSTGGLTSLCGKGTENCIWRQVRVRSCLRV
jgi:hypothetical protein